VNDLLLFNSHTRDTFFTIPPTLGNEPRETRKKKEDANANRHNPRRDLKPIQ
jgi:hypothetical protein